jgi:hypothetical protein
MRWRLFHLQDQSADCLVGTSCTHKPSMHEHSEERNNHLLILDMKETWPDSRPMCVPGMRPY